MIINLTIVLLFAICSLLVCKMQLEFDHKDFTQLAVSPFMEMGAYECLWTEQSASFKTLAEKFNKFDGAVPSDFMSKTTALAMANKVHKKIQESGVRDYGVRVHGAGEYPIQLREAQYPIELLYYEGWWDLVYSPRIISVVGAREPTSEGLSRTRKIVKHLLADDFTIVSGLAKGVDTEAHTTAINQGGRTIAVLGTPISMSYPRENLSLQREIAENHLLISQVPVQRYENQKNPTLNNFFFPERNATMSALTQATIIIEASDTSGTLVQARHAIKQGRKLFILESNFRNPKLKWPHKFEEKGAIRVSDYDDIRKHLIS